MTVFLKVKYVIKWRIVESSTDRFGQYSVIAGYVPVNVRLRSVTFRLRFSYLLIWLCVLRHVPTYFR